MRSEELMGLSWENVDFQTCMITVAKTRQAVDGVGIVIGGTKTGKTRRIPMSSFLTQSLLTYKTRQAQSKELLGSKWPDSPYVFVHENGQLIYPSTPSHWFSQFIRKNHFAWAASHVRNSADWIWLTYRRCQRNIGALSAEHNIDHLLYASIRHRIWHSAKKADQLFSPCITSSDETE